MEFERKELQVIRERAFKKSRMRNLGELWVVAYVDLAQAANNLDAMIARAEKEDGNVGLIDAGGGD